MYGLKSIKRWFRRIGPRIAMCYFIVVLTATLCTTIVYSSLYAHYALQQAHESAAQTMEAMQVNVRQIITNANNYSKLIFSSSLLQTLLRSGNMKSNLCLQARVHTFLFNLMEAVPIIESIYIFDFNGSYFSVSSGQPREFLYNCVEDTQWYPEVMERKGTFVLSTNGGGAFSNPTCKNYVTLVRLIRDVNYTNNLGIMALNIPESVFTESYDNILSSYDMNITVLDKNGERVMSTGDAGDTRTAFLYDCSIGSASINEISLCKFQGEEYLITQLEDDLSGWTFWGMTSVGNISMQSRFSILIVIILLVINGLVLFLASVLISRIFTRPINHLLVTMKSAQEGSYDEIYQNAPTEEFRQLYAGYNSMIVRLKDFHARHMKEQETMRKAELNVLQAQINPHFLYNTLDSIVALALMGDNEQVCRITEALAGYYRLSVSKGKEIITLEEDLKILRNYMIIQQIRYRDMCQIHYDVDDDCLNYMIPKLVLQPLVENALYHGLRAKGESGNIYVSIHKKKENIEIQIRDDGVGMTQDRIKSILDGERKGDVASFGLWGTLERIRIYFGEKSCSHIESKPGWGTNIVLVIPEVRA